MQKIDDTTRAKISQCIADVERNCDSELVCLITQRSAQYILFPLLAAALIALFMPITAVLGFSGWNPSFAQQTLLFIVLVPLFVLTPLHRVLTPNWLRLQNCERYSTEQFFHQKLHETTSRNAILVFVSWDERFVSIVADTGINAKVKQSDWDDLITNFITAIKNDQIEQGFVAMIAGAGDLLKTHFPVSVAKDDELPNHLIELGGPTYIS